MRLSTLLLLCCWLTGAQAADWPAEDPYERAMAVNEGELTFLPAPPDAPVHTHVNRLTILPGSLDTGWVRLEQCHRHLDPVGALEIVFSPGRIRGIQVVEARHIGQVAVAGDTVQLQDIGNDASLCLRAETRALQQLGDGRYALRNGPYMRRFLDGYYPMRVILDVHFPTSLHLQHTDPAAQPGVKVEHSPGHLLLDTWFEGILTTRLIFLRPVDPGQTGGQLQHPES